MPLVNKTSHIAGNLETVYRRIAASAKQYGRDAANITLVAVSKTHPVESVDEAYQWGQRDFGESYLQEALPKITALHGTDIVWHFIGPIQSNKTKAIAEHFDWVHSVDRVKIAHHLNKHRPKNMPPLNICLQVNISGESTKSGISLKELPQLAGHVKFLTHLQLRGLMAIPAPANHFEQQRTAFSKLREAMEQLNLEGFKLDTLSMGMSDDMEAAIAEGATHLRLGTAIFGSRK